MLDSTHFRDPEPEGAVSPAAFLVRPAWPAVSGFRMPAPLRHRQTSGSTCASGETTCPQGGWCCGAGETCSVISGAFFCCPLETGSVGCARVCAAGDFQCGSICCASGQTCEGADTQSPFCTTPSSTRLSSTATSSLPSTSTSSTASSSPTTTSSPPTTLLSTTSTSSSTSTTSTTAPSSPLSTTPPPPATSTTTADTTITATPQKTGLPHTGQIAIGIIVPLAVIFLVAALWFLLFRRPRSNNNQHSHRGHRRWGTGATSSDSQGVVTPPPAYSKSGVGVSVHEGVVGSGEGFEMEDLRGGGGGSGNGERAGEGVGGFRGRASPHPGTVIVV